MKGKRTLYTILVLLLLVGYFLLRQGVLTHRYDQARPGRNEHTSFPAHLIFTKHARCRMDCRHIDESEVKEILDNGSMNNAKSEPDAKPDPKYALEGTTHDGQHVRVIAAPSGSNTIIITVIDLDNEWACHCN